MSLGERLRIWAVPSLLAAATVLLVANLVKRGLSLSLIAANKDALSALSSILSTASIVGASIFAYFRFFRGRTFVPRANLRLDVTVVKNPSGELLHSIVVSIANVGAVTLWKPALSVFARSRHGAGDTGDTTVSVIDKWWDPLEGQRNEPKRLVTVDSGESASFWAERFYGPNVWLVTYVAVVELANGRAWVEYLAVENKPTETQADRHDV